MNAVESTDLLFGTNSLYNDTLEASETQKMLIQTAYTLNLLARSLAACVEEVTRPLPQGHGYMQELTNRVARVAGHCLLFPATAIFTTASGLFYGAACAGKGRFEVIRPSSPVESSNLEQLVVEVQNVCFQNPWAPLTGGVVNPHYPVPGSPSRIAAIVETIQDDTNVFMGQEFEDLASQEEFIRLMKEKGFNYFVRDLGCKGFVLNNSGLFIASKLPIEDIEFVPYPSKDRSGLAKGSLQGALAVTVEMDGKKVRLINTHLNYGNDTTDQAARERQLQNNVVPLIRRAEHANIPVVLAGDLNYHVTTAALEALGLAGYVNDLEGKGTTCSDVGKHHLRQKLLNKLEREEIDGVVFHPERLTVQTNLEFLTRGEERPLSDHYRIRAVISHK